MNLPDMTKTIDDLVAGKITAADALQMWGCRVPRSRRPQLRRIPVSALYPKPAPATRANLIDKIRANFERSGGTVTHADHDSIQIIFQSAEIAARVARELDQLKNDARRFGAVVEIDCDDAEILILVTERN